MSRLFLMLAAAGLLAQNAIAQTELKYAPDIAVGTKLRSEVEVTVDQTLTIAGMPIVTHVENFLVARQTAEERSSDGGWKFAGDFELMQSEMEFPGGLKVTFNSNNPDQAQAPEVLTMIVDVLKATAGLKWTQLTDADHKVVKVEFEGEPFDGIDPSLQGSATPEIMQKEMDIEQARYPDEPVNPGDKWTRIEEMGLGGGQTMTFEKEYVYVGEEEHDGQIMYKVTVKYLTAEFSSGDNPAAPAKVTESELAVKSSEGTMWYDGNAKLFVAAKLSVQVTGSLTLEAGGNKIPGELDLTIASDSKTQVIAPD